MDECRQRGLYQPSMMQWTYYSTFMEARDAEITCRIELGLHAIRQILRFSIQVVFTRSVMVV